MRDIKFRVFDSRNKVMYQYALMGFNGSVHARLNQKDPGSWADITTENANGAYDDYDGQVLLMQFTGKTDKNGVEIYEDDIIRYDFKWHNKPDEVSRVGKISMEEFMWCVDEHSINRISNVEVIGNIHENPELIIALNKED